MSYSEANKLATEIVNDREVLELTEKQRNWLKGRIITSVVTGK